jgi:hypothetical protein
MKIKHLMGPNTPKRREASNLDRCLREVRPRHDDHLRRTPRTSGTATAMDEVSDSSREDRPEEWLTMLRYLGHSAVSGVIGWVALMAAFEGAYWAQAYLTHLRRDAR